MTQVTAGSGRSVGLSQTTLNLLRDCERCFWLHFHGVRRPEAPWATITRGLDRVITRYCKPYRDSDVLPPLLAGLEGKLVTAGVGAYVDPDTGFVLTGRLDECLELPGGFFAPLDHKTRDAPPNGVHDAHQLQLDVYTLLLAESGYAIAGYGVLVYYVPVAGELHDGFPFRVHVHEVDTDPERARTWLRRARAVLDLPHRPEAAPACDYCRWAVDVAPYS